MVLLVLNLMHKNHEINGLLLVVAIHIGSSVYLVYFLLTPLSIQSDKKKRGRRVKRPPPYFIKRKRPRLLRPWKNPRTPEPWPMPTRAMPCSEHSEGDFFTPALPAGKSVPMGDRTPAGRQGALLEPC